MQIGVPNEKRQKMALLGIRLLPEEKLILKRRRFAEACEASKSLLTGLVDPTTGRSSQYTGRPQ